MNPNNEPICITEAQNTALLSLLGPDRQWIGGNLPEWLQPEYGYGAIILKIGGMVIGIEEDGYTHS